jgi:hypothetical protein
MGENGLSVFVDGEKKVALGVQGDTRDVAAMGEGEGMRFVANVRVSTCVWTGECMRIPHLTRSKTVTRLPTGDSRHVPSGLKQRFPRLYTVPSRFENCRRH